MEDMPDTVKRKTPRCSTAPDVTECVLCSWRSLRPILTAMPSMQYRIPILLATGVIYAALVLGCEEAVETRQTGPDVWNAADMMHDILREGPLDATRSVDGHLPLDVISPEEDARVADAEVTARDLGNADPPDAGERDAQSTDRDGAMVGQPDAWVLDGGLPVADADIPRREQRCNDALDDDGDGHVDCEDSDCRGAPVCFDRREVCDDGRDNNGDERIDCDDVTCHLEPGCPPPDVEAFTTEQVEARFLIDCVPLPRAATT